MSLLVLAGLVFGQVPDAGPTPTSSSAASTADTSSTATAAAPTGTASVASAGPSKAEDSWSPRDLWELFELGAPKPPAVPAPDQAASGRPPGPATQPPSVLWPAVMWGLLLFGLGRWLRTRRLSPGFHRGLPLVELATWGAWLATFTAVGLGRDQTWAVGLLWLVVLPPLLAIGFKAARGLQFWLGSGLPDGAAVEVDGRAGRVRRTSAFEVEIETDEGWLVRVPYRSFSERVRVRSRAEAGRVRFEVLLHEQQELRSARLRMIEIVLSSPWSRLEPPVVELEGERSLKVDAAVVDEQAKSLLVSDVRKAWSDLRPPALRSSSVPRGPSAASS